MRSGGAAGRAACRLVLLVALLQARASQQSWATRQEQAEALLSIKSVMFGWDAAIAGHDIRLHGWQNVTRAGGGKAGAGAAAIAVAKGQADPSDPCTWSFVKECDYEGRVMELDLSYFQIWRLGACCRGGADYIGNFPDANNNCTFQLSAPLAALLPTLARLPALLKLSVSRLGLTGSLPREWGAPGALLSRLHYLDLSWNKLTGSIPEAWSAGHSSGGGSSGGSSGHGLGGEGQALPQEEEQQQEQQGQRPLAYLRLEGNNLSGTLPPWLPAAFPNLRSLDMEMNILRGPLPAEWFAPGSWPSLGYMDLSANPIGGMLPHAMPPPAAPSLPAPTVTTDGAAGSSGGEQQGRQQQQQQQGGEVGVPRSQLSDLLLSACELTGTLPADWATAPRMAAVMNVHLDNNHLTGSIPASWGAWGNVTSPTAFSNQYKDPVSVLLPANRLTGPLPCCQTRFLVHPGNEGLCRTPTLPTSPEEAAWLFRAQICHSGDGLRAESADRAAAEAAASSRASSRGYGSSGGGGVGKGLGQQDPAAAAAQAGAAAPGPGPRRASVPAAGAAAVGLAQGAQQQEGQQQQQQYSFPSCSLGPAELPRCGADVTAIQRQQPQPAAAGGGRVAAAAAAAAVMAAAAVLALQWRRAVRSFRMRRGIGGGIRLSAAAAAAAVFPAAAAGGGSGAAGEEVEEGEAEGALHQSLTLLLASGVPRSSATPAAASPPAAAAAGGAAGTASWRLQSASLRLRAEDFTIAVDAGGRPQLLGSGAFSKVYKGMLFGSWPVAIKVLNQAAARQLPPVPAVLGAAAAGSAAGWGVTSAQGKWQQRQEQHQEQRQQRRGWREVELLRQCTHPNIVQLLGVYSSDGSSSGGSSGSGAAIPSSIGGGSSSAATTSRRQQQQFMIVTELLEGGSLHERLAGPQLRWYRSGGRVALDVARAVDFLHQLSIAHLDIKPANVLLTGTGAAGSAHLPWSDSSSGGGSSSEGSGGVQAKVADVGLARMLGQDSMPAGCGTPLFAAPEQLMNGVCGLAADIYGLGWVLHGIASGQRLAKRGEGRPLRAPHDCPAPVVSLVQRCLAADPGARPTACDAVRILASCLQPEQQQSPVGGVPV